VASAQASTAPAAPTTPKAQAAPAATGVSKPLSYHSTTVSISVQVMPAANAQADRMVIGTAHVQGLNPITRMMRWSELEPLPEPLAALVGELRRAFPQAEEGEAAP
jgi:hypothetical protein